MERIKLEEPSDDNGDIFKLITQLTPSGNEFNVNNEYVLHVRANSHRERTGWIGKIREAISEYHTKQKANHVTCK